MKRVETLVQFKWTNSNNKFCAGAVFYDETCVKAAPIIKYMLGKSLRACIGMITAGKHGSFHFINKS